MDTRTHTRERERNIGNIDVIFPNTIEKFGFWLPPKKKLLSNDDLGHFVSQPDLPQVVEASRVHYLSSTN